MSDERESADLFLLAPTWKGRVGAFLRFLAFVALFFVFTVVLLLILGWLLIPDWPRDPMANLGRLLPLQVTAEVLGALAASAISASMARIARAISWSASPAGSASWRCCCSPCASARRWRSRARHARP